MIFINFHGGNVHSYNKDLIDFSSNINPLGVPISFKEAMLSNLDAFTKYPDINYIRLRNSIREYLGVESIENVLVGNGAIELLYRAIQQSGKSKLLCLMPTFSEYSKAASICGIECLKLDAFKNDYQEIDIRQILNSADKESVVVICNPNNPTGTLISKNVLLQLAIELRQKGAYLIVDEAFMEFTGDCSKNSLIDHLKWLNNTIVIKAATKFFGMPGIRLGYAVCSNEEWLIRIRECLEPWNVNTAAEIAGNTVLKDQSYIDKSRSWISAERDFMGNELKNIRGIKVYCSAANFYLIRLLSENLDAWQLKEKLLEKNILIRTPEGFDGLDGQFARLAVKSRKDNLTLLKALKEIL